MLLRALSIALALSFAVPAEARRVSGVEVPDTLTVAGKDIPFHGAGIRKKFVVKVYLGALYLEEPSNDADAVIASEKRKGVQLHFLRDVSKRQIMDAFRDGFRANSGAEADALGPKLERLSKAIPEELREGQRLTIVWNPELGTVVAATGGQPIIIEGKEFSDALFRNWLGPRPADDDMKRRMLGR
jgi:hypothetical protein